MLLYMIFTKHFSSWMHQNIMSISLKVRLDSQTFGDVKTTSFHSIYEITSKCFMLLENSPQCALIIFINTGRLIVKLVKIKKNAPKSQSHYKFKS